ncbi:MAG: helicase SNF2 [Candidatus Omnitrophota bacterium]|nr:MAG: helicase SNF2 [Candidatus Omnitrophota bacterium]
MANYAQTWWGKNWLNALKNIDYSNRLPRGRLYAGRGAVRTIEIKSNVITALVQGSRYDPYEVKITVPCFSNAKKDILIGAITKSPLIITKLLNRQLPIELYELAVSHKIEIFPKSWSDLSMSCSCPDWAVPCKHLAAVIYLIAQEIDQNPFLVFQLKKINLSSELKKKDIFIASDFKEEIKTVDDILSGQNNNQEPRFIPRAVKAAKNDARLIKEKDLSKVRKFNGSRYKIDESLYRNIDFSIIEDLKENILLLLSSSPLFYPKNFKSVLNSSYKSNAALMSKYFYSEKERDPVLFESAQKAEKVSIELGLNLKIKQVLFYVESGIQKLDIKSLLNIIRQVEFKNIKNYDQGFIALYNIYHFTLKLLEKSAFIPQLIRLKDFEYKIRWIPAIINQQVNTLITQLIQITPGDILFIEHKNKKDKQSQLNLQSSREQVISISSLFLNYFVSLSAKHTNFGLNNVFGYSRDQVFNLFFEGKGVCFVERNEKDIPDIIQLWLSKFYITLKNYVPLLRVIERNSKFSIDLMVEDTRQNLQTPIPLKKFSSLKKYASVKFKVMKDLTLLSEQFPQLAKIIDLNWKEKLGFGAKGFIGVFFKILPAVKLFGVKILLPKALKTLVMPRVSLSLKTVGREASVSYLNLSDLLKFDWRIAIGDKLIGLAEFKKLVKSTSGIVKIKGQFVLIDQSKMDELFKKFNTSANLTNNELLKTALTGTYNDAKVGLNQQVKKLIQSFFKIERIMLPDNLFAVLRPYQVRGYEWMYKNAKIGFGSLIADDMGLGKTLQVIALLLKFKQQGNLKNKQVLIIVPTTILTNWQKEIEKFAPDLKVLIYHGQKRKLSGIKNIDIIISTYGIIKSEIIEFEKVKWHTIVIDEAQNIKNPNTAQTKAVKKLSSKVKIAMTGTPVENRLSEYWSILDYTFKGYLGSLTYFNRQFTIPIQVYQNHQRIQTFRKITAPFILRRLKSDKNIVCDLPDKIENNEYCSLTKEQAAIYKNVVENTMEEISSSKGIERRGLVFKLLTALKQICNHPYQFLKKGKKNAQISGKAMLLFNILENIYENNEKVLIFTQYKQMGDLLVNLITEKFNHLPLFLHGGTVRKKRDKMVDDFQNKKNVRIFILSLKAGGTGLNLTAAKNVIHYDLWWNPAVEAQATDRAYRIGQKENVMVYRLLTKSTFEEKIDEMISRKKQLSNLTVSVGEKWVGELSNKELDDLVRLE